MTIASNVAVEQSNPYRKIRISTVDTPNNFKYSNILLDTGSEFNLIPISHAVLQNANLIPCRTHNFKGAFNNKAKAKIQARYKALLNIEFTLTNGKLCKYKSLQTSKRCV